jgi:RNA polymerase subunit RPABC4/transcription elongation factor Spt4
MPNLNLSNLGTFFQYFIAVFGAFFVALWLSLIFWTLRDIRARSQDRFIQILATLVVAILGPLGIFIYLILRPPQTMDEVYQHTLEEEALLTEIEERPVCPGCGARTMADWQFCPHCHTKLQKICLNCNKLMDLPWQLCPYCGTPAPGVRTDEFSSEEFDFDLT